MSVQCLLETDFSPEDINTYLLAVLSSDLNVVPFSSDFAQQLRVLSFCLVNLFVEEQPAISNIFL